LATRVARRQCDQKRFLKTDARLRYLA
jgi:hypothetical protein